MPCEDGPLFVCEAEAVSRLELQRRRHESEGQATDMGWEGCAYERAYLAPSALSLSLCSHDDLCRKHIHAILLLRSWRERNVEAWMNDLRHLYFSSRSNQHLMKRGGKHQAFIFLVLIDSISRPLGSTRSYPHQPPFPNILPPLYITTATWSSMYLLMSPRKHAAMIDTPPNAILTK